MYPLSEHKHFCSTMKCGLPPVGGVESQGATANVQVAAPPGAWKAKGCCGACAVKEQTNLFTHTLS